ncbi:hypothetical protein BDFB_007290 [Asbolus verrucosus]|uniref:Uncharacterized protein n=1 Tax=Asbolus verrucosus TaxID=1661398 RepID=A0A482VXD8_ASBVE|nr:hypothetical protein BDFB_007290 [Asbolus verrucosus]
MVLVPNRYLVGTKGRPSASERIYVCLRIINTLTTPLVKCEWSFPSILSQFCSSI